MKLIILFSFVLVLYAPKARSQGEIDVAAVPVTGFLPAYGVNYASGRIYFSRSDSFPEGALFENRVIAGRRGEHARIVSIPLNGGGNLLEKLEADDVSGHRRVVTMYVDSAGADRFYTVVPLGGRNERVIVAGSLPPFPYNSRKYACAMPFYDGENNRLYFSSDMPGGYGGWDIYYSETDGAGWSKPVNLGEVVNTPSNEIFPSKSKAGLVFSSDRGMGHGGYDNYLFDGQSGELVNLADYNSPENDYSLQFLPGYGGGALGMRDSLLVRYSLVRDPEPQLADAGAGDAVPATGQLAASAPDVSLPRSLYHELRIGNGLTGGCTVYFGYDSFKIAPAYANRLDSLVALHAIDSIVSIIIRAHTDSRGSTRYNDYLSYRRAMEVLSYLTEEIGLLVNKVRLVFGGETYASGDDPVSRRYDRKAEVFLSHAPVPFRLLYLTGRFPFHTLEEVAGLFNNDPEQLRSVNDIKENFLSKDGTWLVGIQGIHQVAPGENLYRIALKYGFIADKLLQANGKEDASVSSGEILIIPFVSSDLKK